MTRHAITTGADDEHGHGEIPDTDALEARMKQAEQALRDFDAAHPTESAERIAERERRTEANKWM